MLYAVWDSKILEKTPWSSNAPKLHERAIFEGFSRDF